jgi:hypothetical protein
MKWWVRIVHGSTLGVKCYHCWVPFTPECQYCTTIFATKNYSPADAVWESKCVCKLKFRTWRISAGRSVSLIPIAYCHRISPGFKRPLYRRRWMLLLSPIHVPMNTYLHNSRCDCTSSRGFVEYYCIITLDVCRRLPMCGLFWVRALVTDQGRSQTMNTVSLAASSAGAYIHLLLHVECSVKPSLSMCIYIHTHTHTHTHTVGSRFMTGLRSRIFGCKSNRRKTSTI